MNATKEIKKVSGLVSHVLSVDERARNDDKWLCYQVFRMIAQHNGHDLFIPFACWEQFPSFETVSRVRRDLQNNKGMYPANAETTAKRSGRKKVMMNYFTTTHRKDDENEGLVWHD